MNNVLYITNPCYLHIKDKNIIVSKKDIGDTRVPIDDVNVVILENNLSTLSSSFLSNIADKNILLFTCDSSYMPNGIFLPFHQHSRYTEVSNMQLEWSEPFKKRIWQKIVINKIENQIQLLKYFGFDTIKLKKYTKQVKSGDSTNIEAIVASIYWSIIFSNSLDYYTRQKNDIRNSALNYGYSIVRSAVARSLVASGFTPFFGIHHHNKLNSFNLVDDIMEVFRCAVDKEVYIMFEEQCFIDDILTKEIKKRLISILGTKMIVNDKKYSFLNAINAYINSFKRSTISKNSDLLLKVALYEQ